MISYLYLLDSFQSLYKLNYTLQYITCIILISIGLYKTPTVQYYPLFYRDTSTSFNAVCFVYIAGTTTDFTERVKNLANARVTECSFQNCPIFTLLTRREDSYYSTIMTSCFKVTIHRVSKSHYPRQTEIKSFYSRAFIQ